MDMITTPLQYRPTTRPHTVEHLTRTISQLILTNTISALTERCQYALSNISGQDVVIEKEHGFPRACPALDVAVNRGNYDAICVIVEVCRPDHRRQSV
jgi:hypothetical protein